MAGRTLRTSKLTSFYGSELARPYVVLKDNGEVEKERVDAPKINDALIGGCARAPGCRAPAQRCWRHGWARCRARPDAEQASTRPRHQQAAATRPPACLHLTMPAKLAADRSRPHASQPSPVLEQSGRRRCPLRRAGPWSSRPRPATPGWTTLRRRAPTSKSSSRQGRRSTCLSVCCVIGDEWSLAPERGGGGQGTASLLSLWKRTTRALCCLLAH